MTLRQLELLRALIRHRTTVAAAKDLGLTQPAVSNALRTMEQQMGFALFHRLNNRLFPTDEARALHEDGEAIFALHARLQGRVQEIQRGTGGRLSIVATPPLAYSLIPTALRRFLAVRPGTRVFLDVRRYEGVTEAVLTRVADLGFALGFVNQPGIGQRVIHTGEMVCALPPAHPLAEKGPLSPRDLAGTSMIGLERGTRLGEAVRASFEAGAHRLRSDGGGSLLQHRLRAGRCGGWGRRRRSVFVIAGCRRLGAAALHALDPGGGSRNLVRGTAALPHR